MCFLIILYLIYSVQCYCGDLDVCWRVFLADLPAPAQSPSPYHRISTSTIILHFGFPIAIFPLRFIHFSATAIVDYLGYESKRRPPSTEPTDANPHRKLVPLEACSTRFAYFIFDLLVPFMDAVKVGPKLAQKPPAKALDNRAKCPIAGLRLEFLETWGHHCLTMLQHNPKSSPLINSKTLATIMLERKASLTHITLILRPWSLKIQL